MSRSPRSRSLAERPGRVLVVTGVGFVALALFVATTGVTVADTSVRDGLLAWSSPALLGVMRVVNVAGYWWVLLPGTLLLGAVFERVRARWWVWAALMVAAPVLEVSLKHLVGRPRPAQPSFGFPSGHATAAAAFFGAVLYLAETLSPVPRRLARACALAMIVLVGLARVFLRAHWPSDVLGGIALGLALASAAALIASAPDPPAESAAGRPPALEPTKAEIRPSP
jgi:membrane-associated phospholipid phosphatase